MDFEAKFEAALLKVTADEPGQRLVLEGEKVALPTLMTGAVGGLVGGLVGTLAQLAGADEAEQWWRTRRMEVDRAAGTLVLDDVQILRNEDRTRSITLDDVGGLTVRARYVPPTSTRRVPVDVEHPRHVEAIVTGKGSADGRVLSLDVLGVDTVEKVADLAYRLGAAMGLRYQRVVHSDPRRMEVEMRAEPAEGLERMAPLEDASDYIGGRVCAAAARAVGEPRIARFDPTAWPSASRVTRWAPGDEVRFDKPREGAALGCLPFALAGLALGPMAWGLSAHDLSTTGIATACGLVGAGLAFAVIAASLPRHARVSWSEHEVTIKSGMTRRRIPLRRVAALELECVRRYFSGSRNRRSRNLFHCRVLAHLRGDGASPSEKVELVATKQFEDQAEPPYEAALPMTRALAEALGVDWRVTDY